MSLYSVGYGSRNILSFIELLKKYNISYLVDVRTKPFSRFNPDFSQANLARQLDSSGVKYVYMGTTLGGLPSSDECYTDGRVDYKKTAKSDTFKLGFERLVSASGISENVVIMCTESKPHECHRCKLIGVELQSAKIDIMHIDEDGVLISQDEALFRLTQGQSNMFAEPLMSNKKYR